MECRGYLEDDKGTLVFEILSDHKGSHKYAFYIFHNGKKIVTRWYENSEEIRLSDMGEGLYYAVGFAKKHDGEPEIMTSSPVQILKPRESAEVPEVTVSIFGSCVSRDLLEYKAACQVMLDMYFARQSIISAVSAKIPIALDDIHLKSNFQKRQIYFDFNKNALKMLEERVSDYLIIDLVDERFSLIKLADSYVTRSNSLVESGLINESMPIVDKEEYIDNVGDRSYRLEGIDIREYMDQFCESILKLYKPERIILHVVKGAEFYYNKDNGIQRFEANISGYFKRLNKMWTFMYDYLREKLYGCHCIDISQGYLADENHVWGLSPIHFQKEYYETVLGEMKQIISSLCCSEDN